MAKPGFKVSGLVAAGKVVVDRNAQASDAFTPPPESPLPTPGVEFMADLSNVDDSPFQKIIRRVLNPARVDEIGQSMGAKGQSTPITVRRKANGRYELIKGHYRKHGALSIGWTQLRAILVVASDKEALRDLMLDNEGTIPTEWGYAHMFRVSREAGEASTQAELATMFACSQAKVSICLAMLNLPPEIQTMLDVDPALLGATAAKTVLDLWEAHPNHHDIIIAAIEKLADGAEQSAIRKDVESQIAALARKSAPPKPPKLQPRRAVIKGHTGSDCYVTILKEDEMTVQFKAPGIDKQLVQQKVNKLLAELAAFPGNDGDG